MANFDIAYALVARAEGGYQKFSDDPGNYNSLGQLVGTNWGISAPVYEGFIGRPPTEEDMRRMTRGQAKALYRALFWNDIRGDEIDDQQVANIFFDGRVNHGRFGVKLMQRTLIVADDGVVGPVTLFAINSGDPSTVFNEYKAARIAFYYELADRRPEMRDRWLPVWLNRMEEFVYNSGPPFMIPPSSTLAAGATPILILLALSLLLNPPR